MIRYVPAPSAEPLSRALWALSRPLSVRGENETTTSLYGTLTDAQDARWLVVPDDHSIRVHPDAEMGEIADILLGAGLPQGEVDQLGKLIVALRGQRMTPWNYFPDVFKAAAKTRAEMIAAGLLTEVTSPQTSPAT